MHHTQTGVKDLLTTTTTTSYTTTTPRGREITTTEHSINVNNDMNNNSHTMPSNTSLYSAMEMCGRGE